MRIILDDGQEVEVDSKKFDRILNAAYINLDHMKNSEGRMFPPTDRKALTFTSDLMSKIELIWVKEAYNSGDVR